MKKNLVSSLKLRKIIAFLLSFLSFFLIFPTNEVYAYTFSLGDYYYLESSLDSNMVVDVSGGSKTDGANIQLYRKNGSDAQLFRIARNGSGYYTFINKGSNKSIDVCGASTNCGANVQQWTQNNTQAQQWKLYTASGYPDTGYVRIMNKCGKYLDVNGGVSKNGTNIQIWDRNNTKAQVFKLVPYVQTTYKTYNLGAFNTIDQWKTRMQYAEQMAIGISNLRYDMNGEIRNYGTMIVGKQVLEYRTITISYSDMGVRKTKRISLPYRIRFKLHKHDTQQLVWFDFSNLTITQKCSCGDFHQFTWEVPYPDT